MATVIRLKRIGSHKRPVFDIVVVDSRVKRDGKVLEILGHYDPCAEGEEKITFSKERVDLWLQRGALVSATVKSLLKLGRKKV